MDKIKDWYERVYHQPWSDDLLNSRNVMLGYANSLPVETRDNYYPGLQQLTPYQQRQQVELQRMAEQVDYNMACLRSIRQPPEDAA